MPTIFSCVATKRQFFEILTERLIFYFHFECSAFGLSVSSVYVTMLRPNALTDLHDIILKYKSQTTNVLWFSFHFRFKVADIYFRTVTEVVGYLVYYV